MSCDFVVYFTLSVFYRVGQTQRDRTDPWGTNGRPVMLLVRGTRTTTFSRVFLSLFQVFVFDNINLGGKVAKN